MGGLKKINHAKLEFRIPFAKMLNRNDILSTFVLSDSINLPINDEK